MVEDRILEQIFKSFERAQTHSFLAFTNPLYYKNTMLMTHTTFVLYDENTLSHDFILTRASL